MKKCSERRKHCVLAVVRWSQRNSPRRRPPSRGRGMARILSAGDGHYLYLQTQFGADQCTQISSYRGNGPTHPPTNTACPPARCKQTGPITIHCAAGSLRCNHVSANVSTQWHNVSHRISNVFHLYHNIVVSSHHMQWYGTVEFNVPLDTV